jgi:hypothetical protein
MTSIIGIILVRIIVSPELNCGASDRPDGFSLHEIFRLAHECSTPVDAPGVIDNV